MSAELTNEPKVGTTQHMSALVRAEWLKLRTIRAVPWLTAATVLASTALIGMVLAVVTSFEALAPARQESVYVVPTPDIAMMFLLVVAGIVGALAFSSEHSHRAITHTLLVTPQRLSLLAAKAGVVAGSVFAATFVILDVLARCSQALIGDRPIPGVSNPAAYDAGLLVAHALLATAMALFGLGLAATTRSLVIPAVATVVVVHVAPIAAQYLRQPWDDRVASVLPAGLSRAVADAWSLPGVSTAQLDPGPAWVAVTLWAAVPVVAGAVELVRRDA